jgi:hypothetical protein
LAVAWVGRIVLVGAPGEGLRQLPGGGVAQGPGAAYLFDGATGSMIRRIESPSPVDGGWFGGAVLRRDGGFAIGAPGDPFTHGGEPAFTSVRSSCSTVRETRPVVLTAPVPARFDRFGVALASWRGRLLVGAPGTDGGGAAYLVQPGEDGMVVSLRSPDESGAPGDRFGAAVALDRDRALVGEPGQLAAFVFHPRTGRLTERLALPPATDDQPFSVSAESVAITRHTLVTDGYDGSGKALVGFTR